MKKITLVALAILFVASMANAQLKFGVKAGANMSDFSTTSSIYDQVKGATNYQFGVLFQAKAFGIGLQPEVLYSVKSGTYTNSTTGLGNEFLSQNIEVPVNLQYGLDLGLFRVYVQGGPYVSFLTGAMIDGSVDSYEDVKENINTIDFGAGIGAGIEILSFQLSAKYDWALTPMGKEVLVAGINTNVFNELKNRNFSISLAYLF